MKRNKQMKRNKLRAVILTAQKSSGYDAQFLADKLEISKAQYYYKLRTKSLKASELLTIAPYLQIEGLTLKELER